MSVTPFKRSGPVTGVNGPAFVVVGPGLPTHGYHFPEHWPGAEVLADLFVAIATRIYEAGRVAGAPHTSVVCGICGTSATVAPSGGQTMAQALDLASEVHRRCQPPAGSTPDEKELARQALARDARARVRPLIEQGNDAERRGLDESPPAGPAQEA